MSRGSSSEKSSRDPAARFHTGVPIGEGASGQVLRCWDPKLERPVAVKILARDDPESVARMLREARVQARVEHANVCEIYDVGELDGRPYIAMQYVDGRALDETARDLSLEDRVELVAQVADAVDAAHRAGLVHRDLKPSNILVEENGNGRAPFVLDFGIARERDAPGPTHTGQVLGTPGYMAPEQARGDIHVVGRRTDVFSLGVILYHLLAGEPPFRGSSSAEVLVGLLSEEYRPLRKAAPGIPRDLATIVGKAMEFDPARRYVSAGTLRDDLRRWLAGDPIEARPATFVYRLSKRVRKHPRLTLAIAAVFLAVLVASVTLRARARQELWLAERYGDRVQRLVNRLNFAYRLPSHDVAPERARVADELAKLATEIEERGRLARGPGSLALGRGLLALERYDEARRHLEQARAAGFDSPAVSLTLGHTLGELYLEDIAAIRRVADPRLRAEATERAERELRAPARALIERAAAAEFELENHELALVEGLIALHRGDLAVALDGARRAGRREWYQQAQLLAARVHIQQASEALSANDLRVAEEAIADARDALEQVTEKAPSDPRGYSGLCRTALLELERLEAAGRQLDTAYRTARDDCGRALAVDSAAIGPRLHRSEAAARMARAATRRGEDPAPFLVAAIADADAARELAPGRAEPFVRLASAWAVRGERANDTGGDPLPAWERAAGHLEAAIERAPADGLLLLELANVLTQWGQNLSFVGDDPLPIWRRAAAAVSRAEEAPEVLAAHLDLGRCRVETEIGYYLFQRGESPGAAFDQAVAACRRAQPALPGHLQATHNLGYALWSRAEYEAASGGDPRDSFRQAAEAFEAVLALDPDRASTRVNTAHLLEELGAWKVAHGEPATEILDRAEGLNRSIAEVYPADFHLIQGKIERVRALDRAARNEDPTTAFTAAERHALRAAELQPGRITEMAPVVDLYASRTRWQRKEGRADAARADAGRCVEWAERALAVEPNQPRIRAALAFCRGL